MIMKHWLVLLQLFEPLGSLEKLTLALVSQALPPKYDVLWK